MDQKGSQIEIKQNIINNILPEPIPKNEPTYNIYKDEYMVDILIDIGLSKNLTLNK